jgi:hypothetical protein
VHLRSRSPQAVPQAAVRTQHLVTYLQILFGPLFLGTAG